MAVIGIAILWLAIMLWAGVSLAQRVDGPDNAGITPSAAGASEDSSH
jgi:hypothetical protein